MIRIAHITDVHVFSPPRVRELTPKRLLGTVNLYIFGRKAHFCRNVQNALPNAVARTEPDILICTGDLTAQATTREFEEFLDIFSPLLHRQPSFLIPGNHDTYTVAAQRDKPIEDRFSPWTGEGPWPRLHLPTEKLALVAIDSCRAHPLSSGLVDPDQLQRLEELLSSDVLDQRQVLILLHYPLRGRHGEPYGPATRSLSNAADVESVLLRHAHKITAILHGHEHHGFETHLQNQEGSIRILNPGASGYAHLPDQDRTAHFNLYELEGDSLSIQRFRYSSERRDFEPEPGGAYATGR
ncbi:MAG: metallophosphoesterase [Myxococcota bacterium]|nr:metallophosphoesterase [Myxococcota bacterium]